MCRVQGSPEAGSLGAKSQQLKHGRQQERRAKVKAGGGEDHVPPQCLPPQLALGAALVNVQIPLLLGQLVEIVAKYTREHVGSFVNESRSLSTKLLLLYGLQVQQEGVPGGSQRGLPGRP